MIGSLQRSVRTLLWDKAPRNHRQDPRPFRVRQAVTAAVVVLGAGVLAWSLAIEPGNPAFYGATLLLAAVWTVGAFASGPLYLGRVARPGRDELGRPVLGGVLLGLVLAGAFVVGALAVREVPFLDRQVSHVLDHASAGVTPVLVVITVLNGVAEELFFRGALYAAVPHHPVLVSAGAYTVATLATGNVMLGFAALLLGLVVGLERRASGGVLAPVLTHVTWSTTMLLVLPMLF
ncbi:MAG: CPBP family glutamic-type intramembrane protease [Nocardioidaceae bacterium]